MTQNNYCDVAPLRKKSLSKKRITLLLQWNSVKVLNTMMKKMLFSFSVDLDFIFGKNAPCPLSSSEASFPFGRVGSLEAGERVNESARGTLGRGKSSQAHLVFFPYPPPPPPRSLCRGESTVPIILLRLNLKTSLIFLITIIFLV